MERRAAYVREAGADVPIVCIHASASSSGQWRPLMDRLAMILPGLLVALTLIVLYDFSKVASTAGIDHCEVPAAATPAIDRHRRRPPPTLALCLTSRQRSGRMKFPGEIAGLAPIQ